MLALLARSLFVVAVVMLVTHVAGCGRTPRVTKLPGDATIIAFGDSLTYGTGADEGESYPAVLERLISRKVIRAGVPGETSTEGLKRLPEVLDEHRPQLLILCLGGNDLLRRMDENATASNLREMVRVARDRGIDVVLLAVPRPAVLTSVPEFYAGIAKDARIAIETDVMKDVLTDNRLKSDLIHPNAAGYARIAESVAKLLRSAGAV